MFQNSTQPNTKKEENAHLQIEIANINNPGNIICHTHTYIYKPQNLNLEKRNSSTKKKIIESTKKIKTCPWGCDIKICLLPSPKRTTSGWRTEKETQFQTNAVVAIANAAECLAWQSSLNVCNCKNRQDILVRLLFSVV